MQLITIALPVYNGAKCIGSSLQSIEDALSLLSHTNRNKIEIIVSDNKSTDKTKEVVEKFTNKLINLTYFCNEKNVGYDGNIDLLVKRSHAKYIWFLGCGEKVKKNALERLIEKLDNDMVYTNIIIDFDVYEELQNKITEERGFNFNNDLLINNKNDFHKHKYSSAVSANIINKNKWLKVIDEPLVVDGWCHIERILNMIALEDNSKTLFLPKPYFTLYREKNGWWTKPDSYLLLLLHINVIESMLKKGFDPKIVKKLKYKQMRMALIGAVLQSKHYGLVVDKDLINEMIRRFKADYFFWLCVFPVLLLPRQLDFIPKGVLKILYLIRKALSNVKNFIS